MSPQDTPDIDISPGQWDIVHDILQRHVPGHEVWAFGSRARRRAKPYSDLDLAIITQAPLPLDTRAVDSARVLRIRSALEGGCRGLVGDQ